MPDPTDPEFPEEEPEDPIDPIEKFLQNETERIRGQCNTSEVDAKTQAIRDALTGSSRQKEFEIMAMMSRMVYDAYRSQGFSDEQAFVFCEFITERTLYPD